jgi:RNA polymerase sigma-70 factor (ECF subfamily)
MSGEDFREEAVLAAVKPIQANSTPNMDGDPIRNAASTTSRPISMASNAVSTTTVGTVEDLFQEHHHRIFRTAHRLTGSAADAEDVLQTVFLRLARGQESPAIGANAAAYFTRAAINASLDLLRTRKRANAVAMDDVENSAELARFVSPGNPETHREDRELRELILGAVSRLGPAAAQMFALRYFEGFDNGEIARVMNTSALVVGVTLHRARARLRKEIGSYLVKHSSV